MCMMSGGMHEISIEGFTGAMGFPPGSFGDEVLVDTPMDEPAPEDS